MSKLQKTVFSKLYRYYCAKSRKRILMSILYAFYSLFIFWSFFGMIKDLSNKASNWQAILAVFSLISGIQLIAMILIILPFVSYLTGRSSGWEQLKNRQFFRMPGISRTEDIKVLIFTPGLDRQTIIWAKFATAFTYFIALNFLFLVLPLSIFLLVATKLGALALLFFFLANGLGFAALNFLLIVPFLFYQQEAGSFLVYFIFFIFIMLLIGGGYFMRKTISQYPFILVLLQVPLSLLVGYSFYSLYRKKFLKHDF